MCSPTPSASVAIVHPYSFRTDMEAYIKSTAAISPQSTFSSEDYLKEMVVPEGEYLKCAEPDYKDFIDPKLSRRMARIIKMGVSAAIKSLRDAGVENPGAIIIGTGLGCLKDTERFLTDLIENNEGVLSPTPFIQSTHNTIGGQIALMLGCNHYNFTYVHRGHSFESSLLDGMMKLSEGADNVLVGGVDESTEATYNIMQQMKCAGALYPDYFRLEKKLDQPVLGEGSAFFVISDQPGPNDYAKISGIKTLYNPANSQEVIETVADFLDEQGLMPGKVSVLLTGKNGVASEDKFYHEVHQGLFAEKPLAGFKNLCGEYQTAAAFGMNLASNMLKEQTVFPVTVLSGIPGDSIEHVLLYNHYKGKNHNLILLSRCSPTG